VRRPAALTLLASIVVLGTAGAPAAAAAADPPAWPGDALPGQGEADQSPAAPPPLPSRPAPAAPTPPSLPAPAAPSQAAPPAPAAPVSLPGPALTPTPAQTQVPTRLREHAIAAGPVLSGPTVPGLVGEILPSGKAVPPAGAPRAVKVLMWTANRLIGLPYRYGGGHVSFADRAYDCSGAVSFALHAAGMLSYPEDSTSLEQWGRPGAGRWVTVYTNRGHAWMIVAGVRLDTSPTGDPAGRDGPRWRPVIPPPRSFRIRRPAG
jgi:cell wall-associated NlpC family hydrolase